MQRLELISLFDDGQLDYSRLKAEGWRGEGESLLFNEWRRIHTTLQQVTNDEINYDYVKVMAGPTPGHQSENFEVGEIIDYLQWLDKSYSHRDVLKLEYVSLRLYGERRLDFKKLMLRGWRFAEIGSSAMPLSKENGHINVLLVPRDYKDLYPEEEPFTEIHLSNSTHSPEAFREGSRFQYGVNAASIREIIYCLDWLDRSVVKYKEQVGFVQSYLGRIRYYRYKFKETSRKKERKRYLETHTW